MPRFTPTEQKLMDVLADGMPHLWSDLAAVIDEYCSRPALQVRLSVIRKKIEPVGLTVVVHFHKRRTHYRLVRLLASAYDGKR